MNEHTRRKAWRGRKIAPVVERLEGRRLLAAFYTGPATSRVVHSSGGAFLIQVSGPGVIKVDPPGLGGINLRAFGTTSDTTISITQERPRWHFPSQYLLINQIKVTSGQLGGLDASFSELNGKITPLKNSMSSLELGSIGPDAQIDVNGNVDTMSVAQVALGPTGHVVITGQLNTTNLSGSMNIGGFSIDGGRFVIGQDSMAPISITGNMTISHNGTFSIGRDMDEPLSVNGNLVLDSGGQLFVGRNLDSLSVDGNLIVNPSGSGIVVNGELGSLSVAGLVQGQGGTTNPTIYDVGVGLGISDLTISGANTNLDGLINANIRAGGSISGVAITYSSVNSTIQEDTPPPSSSSST
jgi:hypothetical protein